MDLGQWIVIVISIGMGVWYVAGAIVNRRRGVATYHWLRSGLQTLGTISEARWIGTSGSGARLVVAEAVKPFRRMEVIFLLESREIAPLWIFNRLRGKQDELILKATLRTAPAGELEAARTGDRTFRDLMAEAPGRAFQRSPGPDGYEIAYRSSADPEILEHLKAFLERYSPAVLRFSLQRPVPHLILRIQIPPLRDHPGADFFANLSSVFLRGNVNVNQ